MPFGLSLLRNLGRRGRNEGSSASHETEPPFFQPHWPSSDVPVEPVTGERPSGALERGDDRESQALESIEEAAGLIQSLIHESPKPRGSVDKTLWPQKVQMVEDKLRLIKSVANTMFVDRREARQELGELEAVRRAYEVASQQYAAAERQRVALANKLRAERGRLEDLVHLLAETGERVERQRSAARRAACYRAERQMMEDQLRQTTVDLGEVEAAFLELLEAGRADGLPEFALPWAARTSEVDVDDLIDSGVPMSPTVLSLLLCKRIAQVRERCRQRMADGSTPDGA